MGSFKDEPPLHATTNKHTLRGLRHHTRYEEVDDVSTRDDVSIRDDVNLRDDVNPRDDVSIGDDVSIRDDVSTKDFENPFKIKGLHTFLPLNGQIFSHILR